MTKELENGQLEWTFEEIDFDGAFDLVEKELDYVIYMKDYLNKKYDSLESDSDRTYNNNFYRKYRERGEMLLQVMGYIRRLSAGMCFHG